jgi:hypothetical protein
MKNIISFLIFLLVAGYSYSQTLCPEIQFAYDASGNRIQRDFNPTNPCDVINNHRPKKRGDSGSLSFNVYPNPAISLLNIDIVSKDSLCSEPILISMYDINAQPVFLGDVSNTKNVKLDISSLAQGTYIVKIVACNKQVSSIVLKVSNTSNSKAAQTSKHVTVVQY